MNNLYRKVADMEPRSAWKKGVKLYALDLLEDLTDEQLHAAGRAGLEALLLNGARSWKDYSWGGCALCYDADIARRLCAPYELRLTRNGARRPNKGEQWLDTQARALYQAAALIRSLLDA